MSITAMKPHRVPFFVPMFNPFVRVLVRLGIRLGPQRAPMVLLTIRGRKTGASYTNPVNMFRVNGRRYVFATFGETSWVKNLRAAGRAELTEGRRRLARRAGAPPRGGRADHARGAHAVPPVAGHSDRAQTFLYGGPPRRNARGLRHRGRPPSGFRAAGVVAALIADSFRGASWEWKSHLGGPTFRTARSITLSMRLNGTARCTSSCGSSRAADWIPD